MNGSELWVGILVVGLFTGGLLYFIFRDARRMDKRPALVRGGKRRKVKPTRGPAKPVPNQPADGAV